MRACDEHLHFAGLLLFSFSLDVLKRNDLRLSWFASKEDHKHQDGAGKTVSKSAEVAKNFTDY